MPPLDFVKGSINLSRGRMPPLRRAVKYPGMEGMINSDHPV